jgi:hypothetical protein
MNNWDSYMDDPFFSKQDYDEEQRIDDESERVDNNIPPMEQMPIASNNIPPMAPMPVASNNIPPMAPMPVASNIAPPPAPMPTAFYPMMPMYCCPPIHWCHPFAGSIPYFVHDDIAGHDMTPPAMPLGMEPMPDTAVGGASLPMSDNNAPAATSPIQAEEMADPYAGQMPETVSGMETPVDPASAPMFPTAGMAPAFPMCSPIMPVGGAMPYYGPTSYYGGMAPYGPFSPVPYMPYR